MNETSPNRAIPDWLDQLAVLKLVYNDENMIVKYLDEDYEEIGISSQSDYDYALDHARKFGNNRLSLVLKLTHERKSVVLLVDDNDYDYNQASTFTSIYSNMAKEKSIISAPIASMSLAEASNNPIDSNMDKYLQNYFQKFKNELVDEIDKRFQNHLEKHDYVMSNSASKLANSESYGMIMKNSTQCLCCKSEDELDAFYDLADDASKSQFENKITKLLELRQQARKFGRQLKLAFLEEEILINGAFNAEFVRDFNMPDGTKCEPNIKFQKTWVLKNTGKLDWNNTTFQVKLVCVSGNIFPVNGDFVNVQPTNANQTATVSVEMVAPTLGGTYFSEWVLSCDGFHFGPKIWCSIQVDEPVLHKNTNNMQLLNVISQSALNPSSQSDETSEADYDILVNVKPNEPDTNAKKVAMLSPSSSTSSSSVSSSSKTNAANQASDFEDEFLVIPDCFDLSKEWKRSKIEQSTSKDLQTSEIIKLIQSEQNSNRKEADIKDQPTVRNGNLDCVTDNLSSYIDIDEYIKHRVSASTREQSDIDENEDINDDIYSIIQNKSQFASSSTSSLDSRSEKESSSEAVVTSKQTRQDDKQSFSPLNIMKNAFSNLSGGPPYVGYIGNTMKSSEQFSSNMHKLIQMGFANRAKNEALLKKYSNDLEKVIQHLVDHSDSNDWSEYRH